MRLKEYFIFLVVAIFSTTQLAIAENNLSVLQGHVTNSKGEELPYVNIYIAKTTWGTTTNSNGDFVLKCRDCKEGDELVFQFVGYKSVKRTLTARDFNESIEIQMEDESYALNAVVLEDGEDPAMGIMRKVIANKDRFNANLENYKMQSYIKSVMKLDSLPEKLPFFLPQDEPIDSSELGIIYLSESLTDYYWKKPDLYKEEMLASKVSGFSSGISFNRVSDMDFDLYENYIEIGGISQRPFISPLSTSAFTYYRFNLTGTFYEEGKLINKIKVSPKRPGDPCFSGDIFVVENEWVLHSVDIELKKGTPIEFADNVRLDQQYIYQDGVWVLFSNNLFLHINIFGFGVGFKITSFYKDYAINKGIEDSFFSNEVFTAEEDVAKKDSSYWADIRPLALTKEEQEDYVEKDSLEAYYESDVYLDSVDLRSNKISLGKIFLSGYTYQKRKNHWRFNLKSLLESVDFNPVEGLSIGLDGKYTKWWDRDISKKAYSIHSRLSYGFSDEKFKGALNFAYKPDYRSHRTWGVSVASELKAINNTEPISRQLSTYYALMSKEHYRKLYRSDELKLGFRDDLWDGFYLSSSLGYQKRSPVYNTENYSWKHKDELYPANNIEDWTEDEIISGELSVVYRHNQKYESNPMYGKQILESPNPDIYMRYKQVVGLSDLAPDYQLLQLGISEETDLKLMGSLIWDMKVSSFLNKENLKFLDYAHFKGNEIPFLFNQSRSTFSGSILQNFHVLPFFEYSTDQDFAEYHVEQHFNGFIMNKIPGVRKLKWQLVSGVNGLVVRDAKPYAEWFVGIENIFKFFRVDWGVQLGENFDRNHSILIGAQFNAF